MNIMKINKPVLIRREVTRYGRVGDLFTACLADDALWEDYSVCTCDFVICTKPYEHCDPFEISGLQYKMMIKEHNEQLRTLTILDTAERKYLKGVIKPFMNQVKYISKVKDRNLDEEYIIIKLKNTYDNCILLPNFKEGTMYKGMEQGKKYILRELGIYED